MQVQRVDDRRLAVSSSDVIAVVCDKALGAWRPLYAIDREHGVTELPHCFELGWEAVEALNRFVRSGDA